jgi:hypothetical protein
MCLDDVKSWGKPEIKGAGKSCPRSFYFIDSTSPSAFSTLEHTHRHLQAKDECDIQSGIL